LENCQGQGFYWRHMYFHNVVRWEEPTITHDDDDDDDDDNSIKLILQVLKLQWALRAKSHFWGKKKELPFLSQVRKNYTSMFLLGLMIHLLNIFIITLCRNDELCFCNKVHGLGILGLGHISQDLKHSLSLQLRAESESEGFCKHIWEQSFKQAKFDMHKKTKYLVVIVLGIVYLPFEEKSNSGPIINQISEIWCYHITSLLGV